MTRTFKSKVDWWYHLLIAMMAVACISCILSQDIVAIIISMATTMLVLHVFFNTYYTIDDDILTLHCSIFPEKKISIHDIEALESSMLPISSYALSLERIIIWKEGRMWMLISPENRDEFVKQLIKINPYIKLKKTQLTDDL